MTLGDCLFLRDAARSVATSSRMLLYAGILTYSNHVRKKILLPREINLLAGFPSLALAASMRAPWGAGPN